MLSIAKRTRQQIKNQKIEKGKGIIKKKYKSITNHNWGDDDKIFNFVVQYLKFNIFPDYVSNKKKRYLFKKFANQYELPKNSTENIKYLLIKNIDFGKSSKNFVEHDYGDNKNYDDNYIDVLGEGYYFVSRPEIKEEIIREIVSMEDMTQAALSASKIHNRILNSKKIINISLNNIKDYLSKYGSIPKSLEINQTRPIKASYRPRYPRQHWQMDTVHMDHLNMSKDNNGYKYFLLIIDIFSKYTYIRRMKHGKSPIEVAEYLEEIFLTGDVPHILQADNGSEFFGDVSKLCEKYNIQQKFTPSYSPQTNGFAENRNKLVKSMIYVHLVNKNKNISGRKNLKWIDVISKIQYSINSLQHSVTKLTPIQVHFGINTQSYKIFDSTISMINTQQVPIEFNSTIKFDSTDKNTISLSKLSNQVLSKNISPEHYKDLNLYEKKRKEATQHRNKFVTTNIHSRADKNESRQANKIEKLQSVFKPGTFVKVVSYLNAGCCDQYTVDLRYKITHDIGDKQKGDSILIDHPFGIDRRQPTKVKKSKLVQKLYNQIFIIHESRKISSGILMYILYKYDIHIGEIEITHKLEYSTSREEDTWNKYFSAKYLFPVSGFEVHRMKHPQSTELKKQKMDDIAKSKEKMIYEQQQQELAKKQKRVKHKTKILDSITTFNKHKTKITFPLQQIFLNHLYHIPNYTEIFLNSSIEVLYLNTNNSFDIYNAVIKEKNGGLHTKKNIINYNFYIKFDKPIDFNILSKDNQNEYNLRYNYLLDPQLYNKMDIIKYDKSKKVYKSGWRFVNEEFFIISLFKRGKLNPHFSERFYI